MSQDWRQFLRGDPLPWLLDPANPAVRAATLQRLLGRPSDDPEVVTARRAALGADPIAAILAAQSRAGWWVKPGPGYAPKYTGTVWSLIFLDQLGADPADERVQLACRYVLRWCPARGQGSGRAAGNGAGVPAQRFGDGTGGSTAVGMGCSGSHKEANPPPSSVLHCLNGNLLRALIGFGHLDDPAVTGAITWAAAAISGTGEPRYYASGTSGPGFACGANDGQPCAWGAVKELLALSRIPESSRSPQVRAALELGGQFLLSRDPAQADYPMGYGNSRPSGSWFKLGFPLGYVADVLQVLEALSELDLIGDPRAEHAIDWLLAGQDEAGRWRNRNAYMSRTVVPFEDPGTQSKWVTLRACAVLRAAAGAR